MTSLFYDYEDLKYLCAFYVPFFLRRVHAKYHSLSISSSAEQDKKTWALYRSLQTVNQPGFIVTTTHSLIYPPSHQITHSPTSFHSLGYLNSGNPSASQSRNTLSGWLKYIFYPVAHIQTTWIRENQFTNPVSLIHMYDRP